MEARYADAVAAGDARAAGAKLVGFTAAVVWQAGDLLEELTRQAAAALGLRGVPPDEQLVAMLDAAAERYSFRTSSTARSKLALVVPGRGAAGPA